MVMGRKLKVEWFKHSYRSINKQRHCQPMQIKWLTMALELIIMGKWLQSKGLL